MVRVVESGPSDPYAELKARIHHACISKLGPEVFNKASSAEELDDLVVHAVTEQLILDRTPLTREERQQIVKEIADDILGYGPLEPFLADDSVTEVMVNGSEQVYVERVGQARAHHGDLRRRRAPAAHHRQDRLAGRPPRSTRRRRWSTRASRTGAASTRSSRRSR